MHLLAIEVRTLPECKYSREPRSIVQFCGLQLSYVYIYLDPKLAKAIHSAVGTQLQMFNCSSADDEPKFLALTRGSSNIAAK